MVQEKDDKCTTLQANAQVDGAENVDLSKERRCELEQFLEKNLFKSASSYLGSFDLHVIFTGVAGQKVDPASEVLPSTYFVLRLIFGCRVLQHQRRDCIPNDLV